MIRLLRHGPKVILAFSVWFGFASHAQCQGLDEATQAKWADELSHEVGNPPERGQVPLSAFEGAAHVSALTNPPFNRYLSLLITDVDTVSTIKFSDVMGQLAQQSGDPLFDKEMLFHQWWDTANQKPGLLLGPHCDDIPAIDQPSYTCPRKLEGAQAIDPTVFADEKLDPDHSLNAYSAIAFSNRFDLLSPAKSATSGQVTYPDCGEYRIIFARNSGKTTPPSLAPDNKLHPGDIFTRNLISFEFRLKNPDPKPQKPGVPQGCLSILKFWYGLSDATLSGAKRGDLLKNFFMNGTMTTTTGQPIGQLPWPVVDIWNLSFGLGQIRTNQFINHVTKTAEVPPPNSYSNGIPASITVDPNDWVLREFRTLIVGDKVLKVLIVPDSTKSTPDSTLFKSIDAAGAAYDPRLPLLLSDIRNQTGDLLGGETGTAFNNMADINAIKFSVLKQAENAFQSEEGSQVPCVTSPTNKSPCVAGAGDIVRVFGSSANVNLSTDIQDDLDALALPPIVDPAKAITPMRVIDRIRTQACAGCHQFSDTKKLNFGFDSVGLGGGAIWPTKACGDYEPSCDLPPNIFLLSDPKKLHPPMQFTQISELILTPSVADNGKGWRYAISSTVECMLDYREKFMGNALGLSLTISSNCPH